MQQHLYALHFPVAGGNKIFANACQKDREEPPEGRHRGALRLSIDGSNSFRRIASGSEKTPFTDIFVNPAGRG